MISKLPEKFPEYAIMYRTLSNQIKYMEKKENSHNGDNSKTQLKIQNYQTELDRIRKMFPEKFFDV